MIIFELSSGSESTKFCSTFLEENDPWRKENFQLDAIHNIHELPIKYQAENKYRPDDYPICENAPLVSDKFLVVIKKLTQNLQFFASEIYLKKLKLFDGYHTLLFTKHYPAIDWDNSICVKTQSGKARSIDKLVLSKSKLSEIPEHEKMFLMEEEPGTILVTEEGKNAIEEAKIKGVMFNELDVV